MILRNPFHNHQIIQDKFVRQARINLTSYITRLEIKSAMIFDRTCQNSVIPFPKEVDNVMS